jgi:hypothetical protein
VFPIASSLQALSDEELLCALQALSARSCGVEAELLAHLGEVDTRRLYLEQGYPSLFAYCTDALHFWRATAGAGETTCGAGLAPGPAPYRPSAEAGSAGVGDADLVSPGRPAYPHPPVSPQVGQA